MNPSLAASRTRTAALRTLLAGAAVLSAGITSASALFSLTAAVAPGANLLLRWIDDNAVQTSPDQIIGLNNVSVSAVPLPAALPLLLSALGGLGLLARRRRNLARG